MVRPTFLGIGAQKCASTWLYDILLDHPQLSLSVPKELDFFSYHYDHGFQWYERHFSVRTGTHAIGEISPSYFHEPAVPARVKSYAPGIKILVSLRDPVHRAISNHKHEVRIGHFKGQDLSFEVGLANNPMYIEQGLYATHLSRWLEHFSPNQMLMIFLEDIRADHAGVARRVYEFLGVGPEHRSAGLEKRSNASHIHRFSGLEKLRKALRLTACKAGLEKPWNAARHLGLQRLYNKLNRLPSETVIPPVSEVTIRALRMRFKDEIRRLEQLSDRSLAHWC
jgi:hypothetical protein